MNLKRLQPLRAQEWLNTAADLIEERGWIQGVNCHRRSGRIDVLGAIGLAMGCSRPDLFGGMATIYEGVPPVRKELVIEVVEVAEAKLGEDLGQWNDAPDRTQEGVVEFLRSLAAEIGSA